MFFAATACSRILWGRREKDATEHLAMACPKKKFLSDVKARPEKRRRPVAKWRERAAKEGLAHHQQTGQKNFLKSCGWRTDG